RVARRPVNCSRVSRSRRTPMARPRTKKPVPRSGPPRRAAAPALAGPLAPGTAGAILTCLGGLALTRRALAFEPSMWAWSLNRQRFLAPGAGWGLWALAAAALIPTLARRAAPLWNAAGDAIARHPTLATWAGFVTAVLLVGLFPDRVRFTGDFL